MSSGFPLSRIGKALNCICSAVFTCRARAGAARMNRLCAFAILVSTIFASTTFAQVAVTNPGNATPALAATYTSLANAITALNGTTSLSGQVIITLTGNETAPAGGYAINFTGGTPTGASATNNIIIQGSGSTITAF